MFGLQFKYLTQLSTFEVSLNIVSPCLAQLLRSKYETILFQTLIKIYFSIEKVLTIVETSSLIDNFFYLNALKIVKPLNQT